MNAEIASEFDVGPLSWVQAEIDQALQRGLDALAIFAAGRDATALRHARTHIHQAAGAIQMVGLDAVTAYTDEIERALASLEAAGEGDPKSEPGAVCAAVDRAGRKLRVFLSELVNGAPLVAMRLLPEYETMQKLRGVAAPAPWELFFPDLSARAPKAIAVPNAMAGRPGSQLVLQRRQFQQGLLLLLRGERAGAATMREAVAGIEAATAQPAARSFWWTVGALLDAIVAKGLDADVGVKQLAARIDLQIRRLVEGATTVADRLRREVLYHVAISMPVAPSVWEVQRAFRLSELLPAKSTLSDDALRIEPLLRQAKEQIGGAKDAWLKFTSGRAENLPKLKQTMAAVREAARDIGHPGLAKLTDSLAVRLEKMPAGAVAEPIAMEYATGLLLAENSLANFASLTPDFGKQVDLMLSRLDAVQAGHTVDAGSAAPLLDEMSKRAQERMLLAQVCREIQVNLRRMEQVLDGFFRDPGKRADLALLDKDSGQIRGALRMLGLDQAERLLALCEAQIETYTHPEVEVGSEDLELLAESLSSLGFYVEAVEQQRPGRERLIAPLLAKRLGEAPAPVEEATRSAEAALAELRAALPALLEEVRAAPADEIALAALKTKLRVLRDDANLMGDAALVTQADAALQELASGGTSALAATVSAIADATPTAPAISEETQRLLASDEKALDAEFLDIYLTEAGEVLDAIAESRATLQHNHGARDALRIARRGFHTLKGSGRMVGLNELGELAYAVETVHNRLLEEDRPVTPAVIALIGVAEQSFREWVAALRQDGRVRPDATALLAAIRDVEAPWMVAATPPEPVEVVEAEAASLEPAAAFDIAEVGTSGATRPEVVALEESSELAEMEDDVGMVAPETAKAMAADDAAAVAESDAAAELPSTSPHELAPEPEPEDVTIGGVTVSLSLFRILIDEAEQHLATLGSELETLQFDPSATPSASMVRASHTLCGIHRTAGFALIATTARSLEQCLLALQQGGAPLSDAVLPVVGRAIEGLGDFVLRVRNREGFTAEDEAEAQAIQAALDTLRLETSAAQMAADAEAQAARDAAPEDERQAQEAEAAAQAREAEEVAQARETEAAEQAWEAEASARPISPALHEVPPPPDEPAPVEVPAQPEPPPQPDVTPQPEFPPQPDERPLVPQEPEVPQQPDMPPQPETPPQLDVPALFQAQPPAVAPTTEAPHADMPAPGEPRSAPVAPPEIDPIIAVRDDVDGQLLPIFLEEATELFPQAGEALRAWQRRPDDLDNAQRLRRTLHTFKGSARMAGAMRLGALTHRMESRLLEDDGVVPPARGVFDALDADLDHIAYVLDALRMGRTNVPLPWLDVNAAPSGLADAGVVSTRVAPPSEAMAPHSESPVVVPFPARPSAPVPGLAAEARDDAIEADSGQRALLRVRADIVDRLVNEAGEVSITRSRIDGELRALKANLLELTSSVIRLRAQVREIEMQGESQIQSHMSQSGGEAEGFDPLEFDRYTRFQELTRSLAEGVNDVATVQQSLLKNIDDADAALLAQARLSREMQQQLFSIRTVPFGSLSERLYRILRQTAKELDKRANLEIRGAQVELDRSVLEKLVGPLEHLLRNALDHGIEPRDVRVAAGKTETGEIALTVRQVGNEIAIEIADDGAGIDLGEIRAKAVAQGVIAADAEPTTAQLIEYIFRSGFTTATRVTAVSGRGIGMDVVRSEVGALGGRVEVATTPGRGTTFLLYLPLTLAVAQAVLVRAAGRLWALPAPMVEQVQQVKPEALLNLYVARAVEWQGRSYPFHYLPRLLGDTQHTPESSRYNPVILLRTGQSTVAVHVDEMIGNQEVVVKNIGPQLARVSGIAGATVLGNGEIVLIINPVPLAQRTGVPVFEPGAPDQLVMPRAGSPGARPAVAAPLIMIVDDSLTVRKVTSRMLVREGFAVVTAKDGADALQLLDTETPDVILLDIEMPRMDGFEFTKMIKGDARRSNIPIIMITSRTAEKHRNRAKELGVDLYLGKPFQEDELLRHLREMLALSS